VATSGITTKSTKTTRKAYGIGLVPSVLKLRFFVVKTDFVSTPTSGITTKSTKTTRKAYGIGLVPSVLKLCFFVVKTDVVSTQDRTPPNRHRSHQTRGGGRQREGREKGRQTTYGTH
jgi:hypothetical protein